MEVKLTPQRYLTFTDTIMHVCLGAGKDHFLQSSFFRHVLKRPYELGDKVKRARRTRYVPVVLSRGELDEVLYHIHDSQFSKALRWSVREAGIPQKKSIMPFEFPLRFFM